MSALAADLWVEVLPYLSEVQIYRLRCSGDKIVQDALARRRNASFQLFVKPFVCWPTHIAASTYLQELSISIYRSDRLRNNTNSALDLSILPRSLTKLNLDIPTRSTPFSIQDVSLASSHIQDLDNCLPNLAELCINHFGKYGYWTLPSSVTHFVGTGSILHESICLPPFLLHLSIDTIINHDWANVLLPNLQTLITSDGIKNLPHLPDLTRLDILTTARVPKDQIGSFIQSCSSLQELTLDFTVGSELTRFLPRTLCKLRVTRSQVIETIHLPPSLTSIECIHDLGGVQPFQFPFDSLNHLPPSLRTLSIGLSILPSDIDIRSLLSRNLVGFISPQLYLRPSEIVLLPVTLTSLSTKALTLESAAELGRFPHLTDLTLNETLLSTDMVQQLPPFLHTLTLRQASLPWLPVRDVGGCDFDPSALFALPPHLHTLRIYDTKWKIMAYDYFRLLPTSLKTFVFQDHHSYATIHFLPLDDAHLSGATSHKFCQHHDTRHMEVISRLTNLEVLRLRASIPQCQIDTFCKSLPPSVTALEAIVDTTVEFPMVPLPPTVRFYSGGTSSAAPLERYLDATCKA